MKKPSIVIAILFTLLSIFCLVVAQYSDVSETVSSNLNLKSEGEQDFESPEIRYARFLTKEKLEKYRKHKKEFLHKYSKNGEYGYDGRIDEFVATNLPRMKGHVYLDYTGSGVYSSSQLKACMEDLTTNVYGNAHSRNPSSLATEEKINNIRERVLEFFGTNSDDYSVIFTSGATGALKIVAEGFPWTNKSSFVYTRVNHNSVLGIREVAEDQGAVWSAVHEDNVNPDDCAQMLSSKTCSVPGPAVGRRSKTLTSFPSEEHNLFAYPAEDNFAGGLYPMEWIDMFHDGRLGKSGHWMVLLDAAAYVPTHSLDLSKFPADFVTVSFYKMFGYPTGLGALIIRNDALEIMQKTFFGGGTVIMTACDRNFTVLQPCGSARFEDGTLAFLSILSLEQGFNQLEEFGMDSIDSHTKALTKYAYSRLSKLKHSNGRPIARVYGRHKDNPEMQGNILNFNLLNNRGEFIGYYGVQEESAKYGIHLRTGCNCNPGACYDYLGLTTEQVMDFTHSKTRCSDRLDMVGGKPLGSVRVSIGMYSTFEDIEIFLNFIEETYRDSVSGCGRKGKSCLPVDLPLSGLYSKSFA